MAQQVQNLIDLGAITLVSTTPMLVYWQDKILVLYKIDEWAYIAAHAILVKLFILKGRIELVLFYKHFMQIGNKLLLF